MGGAIESPLMHHQRATHSPLRPALPPSRSLAALGLALATIGFTLSAAAPAAAQAVVSREVVQPTGSADVERLNAALLRLAASPGDTSALVEAGHAALQLNDLEAAIGFFGRAQDLAPGNAQAKLGMAAAQVRSQQPGEALRLFAEAQQAGAAIGEVAADRGLAYDLVGNNAAAQADYRLALSRQHDDEVARRLAISLAISGDRTGFEATLLPMLERRDFAAYRARAFGLAILGNEAEAASIAETVMPPDLAGRLAPYLAYMRHLTRAQQAAAANLGIFPRAAQIGRDDPRIAQAAQGGVATPRADSRLVPAGEPLGGSSSGQRGGRADQAAPTTQPGAPQPVSAPGRPSVSSVFGSLAEPANKSPTVAAGAVDVSAIEAPREIVPKPVQHPSRIWVQVATGVDLKALTFDWRRMARKYPDQLGKFDPHVVKWGQANRLLAGPIASPGDARALVNALKAQGLDSFVYTSPDGQEISEIK